jgi:hypothetical protein
MKSRLYSILYLGLTCMLFSCKKGLLGGEGRIVITQRSAPSFHKISLYHHIDLVLTQDTVENIKVEAGENRQPSIVTAVEGDELVIKNDANSLVNRPGEVIRVYVSVKELQLLNYQGSGTITCSNTLQMSQFTVLSNLGAGDVHLNLDVQQLTAGIYEDNADFIFRGKADQCYTYCASRGTIHYENLEVRDMQLDYSSARDAYVHVTGFLKGTIYYKGNVYYKGTPVLQTNMPDAGRFIPY